MAKRYVPALGWHVLTPLYDALARMFAREATLKPALVAQAAIDDVERVLDLGCGTGTLALLVRRRAASARVIGLDRDAGVLAIARRKIARDEEQIPLLLASSTRLPFTEGTFDRVLVSFVFHHLDTGEKERTLAEVGRVLRPGGELHVVDWEAPQNALMALVTVPMTWFEGTKRFS